MSREIKFRQFYNERMSFFGLLDEGVFTNPPCSLFDRYPPMQFTGLTDVNGVEIYEGDVVTAGIRGGNVLSTYVIQWDSVYGCWYGNLVKTCELGNIDCRPLGEIRFNANIIGNIHQNPELLK